MSRGHRPVTTSIRITAPRDDLAYLLANVGPLLTLAGVNPAVVAGVVDSHANESGAH